MLVFRTILRTYLMDDPLWHTYRMCAPYDLYNAGNYFILMAFKFT